MSGNETFMEAIRFVSGTVRALRGDLSGRWKMLGAHRESPCLPLGSKGF